MQHLSHMTKEAIHTTLNSQPFRPFALRLTDGSLVSVPHPEFIAVSQGGRTAVVFTEGEKFSILDLGLVMAIETNSSTTR